MLRKKLFWVMALGSITGTLSCEEEITPGKIPISGNIELTEVSLAFKVPGQLVELKVDEGDFVRAGDLIARMDAEQLERQKDAAVARRNSAQSRKSEIEALVEFQRANVEAQIRERRAALRQAEAALERAETGSRVQEIEEAEAAVSRARADHERAKREWERGEILFDNEDISVDQHDRLKAALDTSAATLRQALERLELVKEGPRREDIEMARQAVAQARAGLEVAESRRLDVRRNERAVRTVQAEIEAAEAEIGLLESRLRDMVITAPISGVVLSKAVEVGEVIAGGTPIVTIGDLDHPWLRGYILETDLGKVRLGDGVEVYSDSFPGKTYAGRVSFISSEAEFTPKQIHTPEERVKMVYRIKADLENPDQELKLNMPVEGVVILRDGVNR